MKIMGIDPGLNGAVATYDGENLVIVRTEDFTFGFSRFDFAHWNKMADAIDEIIDGCDAIFIERVGARPKQGTSSMFTFGFVTGVVRGMVAQYGIPVVYVLPQKWKAAYKLESGKNKKKSAVFEATNHFPNHPGNFRGPKGGYLDGPAEAALIALYGYNHYRMPDNE